MKPKKKAKVTAKAELETFGGDYHRLESTFRMPERFRRVGKGSGGKGSKARPRPSGS